MKQESRIFVLYDGIENSVFDGQVLQPLLQRLENNSDQNILLVSFERTQPNKEKLKQLNELHPKLAVLIAKKIPFFGMVSMFYAARHLKKIVAGYQEYHLLARGPLAGVIALKAVTHQCASLTIQARGLLVEEYAYAHEHEKKISSTFWHRFRQWQLRSLENKAYSPAKTTIPITIEAVSAALKEYLFNTYGTDLASITIAQSDIPTSLPTTQLSSWKESVRTELSIPQKAHVYCYNGSIKAWQCPEKVASYFNEMLHADPQAFLLVLTQDCEPFKKLLDQNKIPHNKCLVMRVHHSAIYKYLAACDIGLLFRENHIVNWVSRPTKALEYQATGLKIEHNNTVEWLNSH